MPEIKIPLVTDVSIRMDMDSQSDSTYGAEDISYEWTSGIFNGVVNKKSNGEFEVVRRWGFDLYRYKDFDQDAHGSGYTYDPENNHHWWVCNSSSNAYDYICEDDGGNIDDINWRVSTSANVSRYSSSYSSKYNSIYFIGTDIQNATSGVKSKIFYAPRSGGGVLSNLTVGSHGIPDEHYCTGLHFYHDYMFLMTESGKIHNSNLSTPDTWTSTDFVSVSDSAGYPVHLAKHNDNLVACSSGSIEFFYDAGNPSGSPLAPRRELAVPLGVMCEVKNDRAVSQAIDSDDEHIVFLAQRRERNNQSGDISSNHDGIWLIENYRPRKISTNDIDILIGEHLVNGASLSGANQASMRLRMFSYMGRKFVSLVGVTAYPSDITGDTRGTSTNLTANGNLVYDLELGIWYIWKWASDTKFEVMDTSGDYILYTYGMIMRGHAGLTADQVTVSPRQIYNFPFAILVDAYDGGTYNYKFCTGTRLEGHYAEQTHNMTIHFMDNDSVDTTKATTSRTYDLQYHRPLTRCGRFRRRRFAIEKDYDDTGAGLPISLKYLVLSGDVGTTGEGDSGGV